ncbi:MAG: helix-turn-helix domain-containing protein [Dehalococcoidia bacterium]|nr:helix-turn-helix domain-containing protein [Dehalococcoidia bacterium]
MHEFPGDPALALPARFRRVLVLIDEGQNNAEIADALGLSRHTVENYVSE